MSTVTPSQPLAGRRPARDTGAERSMLGDALSRPLASYYLLLVCVGLLVAVGLVMVWSASSVYAMVEMGNSYYYFLRQLTFLGFGLPVALVLSHCGEWGMRLPGLRRLIGTQDAPLATERVLKAVGGAAMALSLALLVLVVATPLGVERYGNRAWLDLGPIEIQPSEFAKVSLVLWSAALFANRRAALDRPGRVLRPYFAVSALLLALVVAERDLGTMLIVAAIVVLQLWFVGVPGRIMAAIAALGAGGLGGLVFVEAVVLHKMTHVCRIVTWANQMLGAHLASAGCTASDQPANALLGLATGGWWGVGLGASRQKWGGLYNGAQTDYIVAVLGEEWGLAGTLLVIALFCVLGFTGLRVASRSDSLFRRVVAGGLTGWLLVQAALNILVALGLFPVAGVPLPFLSYGGSGLMANLIAVGVLLALARQEPAAAAVLAARRRATPRLTGVVAAGR